MGNLRVAFFYTVRNMPPARFSLGVIAARSVAAAESRFTSSLWQHIACTSSLHRCAATAPHSALTQSGASALPWPAQSEDAYKCGVCRAPCPFCGGLPIPC